ncbi:MAG: rod-binding protein [Treponema sp.]|nr:rod-binding protein [Treponema sp.]
MELAGLGFINTDDYRSSAAMNAHRTNNFAELLEKAQERNSALANAPLESKTGFSKTEIDKTDRLYELCLELETFLVKNLLNSMRSTVQKSGLVDDSFAGKMYEDMLYDEYAKSFTKSASFGLADQAYLQLKQFS